MYIYIFNVMISRKEENTQLNKNLLCKKYVLINAELFDFFSEILQISKVLTVEKTNI